MSEPPPKRTLTHRLVQRLGATIPADHEHWGLASFARRFLADHWRNTLFVLSRNNMLLGPTLSTQVLRPLLNRWRGVKLGEGVGIGDGAIVGLTYPEQVTIGDRCRISANVVLNEHGRDLMGYRAGMSLLEVPESVRPITIEQDCHIGVGAIILAGVTIGRGSIVGAGSVVRQSVPPYSLVIGNPAKVVASFDPSS